MPARNKHQAGRRGRDVYDSLDRNDLPHREPARARIERLTRTATALGGYDRMYSGERGPEGDLDAVADELDRLLSEQAEREVPQRRRGRSSRSAPRRGRERAPEAGIDDVMGALDRLDRQVQGLAGDEDYADDYERAPSRSHRPGRYAIDALNESDPYGDDDVYYDDDPYADYGDEDDAYYQRAPRRSSIASRNASMHAYKDLGRRIDALRKPQEQALAHVREELGSLRDALGGIARGTNETVSRQNAELRRLADMVDRLRNDKKNDQLAKEIRKEVAELKSLVGRTNVEGALQTLEHGYAHILQRLDELSRASVDPRVLRSVTVRLNEIEDAFAALPRSEHMMVLEDRVVSIAERMEELLQRKDHAEIEPLRAELREVRGFVQQIDVKGLVESIDDRMKFVSNRLDDLETLAKEQRGLDNRLSAMEQRMPEPETITRLQGRLEDIVGMMADDRSAPADQEHLAQLDHRLNDIVDRLERMEQAKPIQSGDPSAFDALGKRLEAISTKIDAIEKRAVRPVIAPVAAAQSASGADTEFFAQIQDRLNDLTTRLDQPKDTVTTSDLDKLRSEITAMRERVAQPASTDALEQRISDLAQLVTTSGGKVDDKGLEVLGAKVAALAEQIETSSSNAQNSDQISSVLERIEAGLAETRSDVAGIARKAAQEAVANAPKAKNSEYDAAISSLQNDLKRLLDAAEGSEERTRNTFDGVKSVLGSITERLDTLERVEPAPKQTSDPAPEAAGGLFSPIKVAERPPLFAKAQPDVAQSKAQAEPAPLPVEDTPEPPRDRKADFIAAARRAAQAASAEAAQLEKKKPAKEEAESADEERGKARVGWLRNVLKRSPAEKEETVDEALELKTADINPAEVEQSEEQTTVLAGDRVAPEPAQASGGRRRAILYTAAAVVLLMAGFYVTRGALSPSDTSPQVAAVPQDEAVVGEAAQASPAEETASSIAASEPETVSEGQGASDSPQPIAASDPMPAIEGSVALAPPATTQPPVAAADPVPTPAAASQSLEAEPGVAFAPPSGVENSFGAAPAGVSSGFTAAGASEPAAGEAGAALLASLPPEGVGPMALRSAAASGDAAAEFLIGVKYTEGDGVAADLAKAAAWYQKAADKGLAPAQYRLASLYEKGRGVQKDLPKAKAWYTQSAEAGNAKAMHNLAVLFAEGGGGQPDYASAAKWFEDAANYGVKDSLFNLGILYAGGIGVDKDLIASYKWFAIAADQGDPEAAKRRDDVANMMDQETLASARLAVEGFKLKTPDPAANKVTLQPSWTEGSALPASNASVTAVDNSAMIREAQDKLNYLGFDTGTPDGQMGPRTRSAIRAFQRSLGLPETGQVDSRLMDELKSQAI